MATLHQTGEHELIRTLVARLKSRSDVLTGPGDDCAVVRPDDADRCDWLLTTDPVIEGVHFDRDADAGDIGHKAAGRALSDIAAMGGEPCWLLINLTATPEEDAERVQRAFRGAARLAERFGCAVVGGDVSTGRAFELHVFAIGRVPAGTAMRRSGARPGEAVCVTGSLGGASQGRHMRFEPRLSEGRFLREWATAAIDISDGIATDARHVMEASKVGMCIDLASVPVSDAARENASEKTALERALCEGEDFELLFTLKAAAVDDFRAAWDAAGLCPFTRIGQITPGANQLSVKNAEGTIKPLEAWGFRHFD